MAHRQEESKGAAWNGHRSRRQTEQRFADCFNVDRACSLKGDRSANSALLLHCFSSPWMALAPFWVLKPWCRSVADKIRGLGLQIGGERQESLDHDWFNRRQQHPTPSTTTTVFCRPNTWLNKHNPLLKHNGPCRYSATLTVSSRSLARHVLLLSSHRTAPESFQLGRRAVDSSNSTTLSWRFTRASRQPLRRKGPAHPDPDLCWEISLGTADNWQVEPLSRMSCPCLEDLGKRNPCFACLGSRYADQGAPRRQGHRPAKRLLWVVYLGWHLGSRLPGP